MKYLTTIVILFSYCLSAFGQQESINSQYIFNPLSVNPGYTGFFKTLTANAMYRFQSLGIYGAPVTQTLTIHSPLRLQQAALGLQVWNQSLGVSRQTSALISSAYNFQAGSLTVSFGLQTGIRISETDFTKLTTKQGNDPVFEEKAKSYSPNFGFGIYVHNRDLYAGISLPELIITNNDNTTTTIRPLIVLGGYVFDLNENVKFKPNGMVKIVNFRIVEYNINTSFIFQEVLLVGVAYRPGTAITGLLQLYITDQLQFGYTYDASLNDLSKASAGSHEISIQYIFRHLRKNVFSPRYF